MSTTIQFKRGNKQKLDQYVGQSGEVLVNTDDYSLRYFDGSVVGGYVIDSLDIIDAGIIPEPVQENIPDFNNVYSYKVDETGKVIEDNGLVYTFIWDATDDDDNHLPIANKAIELLQLMLDVYDLSEDVQPYYQEAIEKIEGKAAYGGYFGLLGANVNPHTFTKNPDGKYEVEGAFTWITDDKENIQHCLTVESEQFIHDLISIDKENKVLKFDFNFTVPDLINDKCDTTKTYSTDLGPLSLVIPYDYISYKEGNKVYPYLKDENLIEKIVDKKIAELSDKRLNKRSDYNLVFYADKTITLNTDFAPIMIWVRVNPNDSSKLQYYEEGTDTDWNDNMRSKIEIHNDDPTVKLSDDEVVEDIITQVSSKYVPSRTPTSVSVNIKNYIDTRKFKLGSGFVASNIWSGYSSDLVNNYEVLGSIIFNNKTIELPSYQWINGSSGTIAVYQNIFEKGWFLGHYA